MKLRNKKTGGIYNLNEFCLYDDNGFAMRPFLRSLAELNADWEDYEELKEYWYIDWTPEIGVYHTRDTGSDADEREKEIGNYFETKEEAEKAVEKLKAWKRLKDKGFRFEGIKEDYTRIPQFLTPFRDGKIYLQFNKSEDEDWMKENWKDLDLLFGGEDE